ncbi:hypothetical protein SDC9_129033 [bioreactor metagenome]|uniref:Uncharacterized protein n=1 Tax=bioreactor metagenome TaxID=1076179 RepID=A0A645CYL7_9ZZZZ
MLRVQGFHVHAPDAHRSPIHIPEPGDKPGNRALPAAGGSHQRGDGAAGNGRGQLGHGGLSGAFLPSVREGHMVKLNVKPLNPPLGIPLHHRGGKEGAHPSGGNGQVKQLRQKGQLGLNRSVNTHHDQKEHQQGHQLDSAACEQMGSHKHRQADARLQNHLRAGNEHAVNQLHLYGKALHKVQGIPQGGEPLAVQIARLDNLDALQVLLHLVRGRQLGVHVLMPVMLLNLAAEQHDKECSRHGGKHRKRKPPVIQGQHQANQGDGNAVGNKLGYHMTEHMLHGGAVAHNVGGQL